MYCCINHQIKANIIKTALIHYTGKDKTYSFFTYQEAIENGRFHLKAISIQIYVK